jgi:hypothetical protein
MSNGPRLHIICERDVGLFSLIQQVIANIPWALAENRVPIVHFGPSTCYWTPTGYRGKDTVWEYYFEPLVPGYGVASIPLVVREPIATAPPRAKDIGYLASDNIFVSSHYGDHPDLRGRTIPIPYKWDDPDSELRHRAKKIIDRFIRPRPYLVGKAADFFTKRLTGSYVIGVHARGTDATSAQERRPFRQASLVLPRYTAEISRLLELYPEAKVFAASDEQASLDYLSSVFGSRVLSYDSIRHRDGEASGKGPTGWIMPAYIARDRLAAARNGEEAVIEYLLLSQCNYLVHNGSSLARTVLLNAPELPHTNTHRRPPGSVTGAAASARLSPDEVERQKDDSANEPAG